MIYEPSGKAREYSPLALNVYRNCDHQCSYCYVRNFQPGFSSDVSPVSLVGLEREASKASRQVLLCFTGDPYCKANDRLGNTAKALAVLKQARCSVAILTKGGSRCLQDLELIRDWPEGRIKYGATLTFVKDSDSLEYEPGAALPGDRMGALEILHRQGLKTWVSIEPVIDPKQSLEIIRLTSGFVDQYKIGKLNHVANRTDWRAFCKESVEFLRRAGKQFYVKDDLAAYMPVWFLSKDETNAELVLLPDRKSIVESPRIESQVMFPGF